MESATEAALRALRDASDAALMKRYRKTKPKEEEQEEKSDEYAISDDDLAALESELAK